MSALGWRIVPIFFLSFRQFVGGKAIRAVFALGMIPALFAVIYRIDPNVDRPRRFLDGIIIEVMLPTVLPLAALILATATFGDEIEDRTLPYLVLKPITRFRIVFEKLMAAVVVAAPISTIGGIVSWFLVFGGDGVANKDLIWAILLATLTGVFIYSAVFQLISLLIRRAILASIVYSIVWESVLGRFIPGLRYLSIRHVVVSVYTSTIQSTSPSGRVDRGLGISNAFSTGGAVVAAAVVCLIAILLSTWRLKRINID